MSRKELPIEPKYTAAEMNEIIGLFAVHIVRTYALSSRRFVGCALPNVTPEALVLVWQKEMEAVSEKTL